MSSMDVLRELSGIDESLIRKHRKHVSIRMNIILCFIAANITHVFEAGIAFEIVAFFVVFVVLYVSVSWYINRNRKNSLLIEDDAEVSD